MKGDAVCSHFLSKGELTSEKTNSMKLKAEQTASHDLPKSQGEKTLKPPSSGDTSPRSRSQLPQPDTCKRPLFSLSPSSPPPALAEIDGARTAAAVEEGLGCTTAGLRESPSPGWAESQPALERKETKVSCAHFSSGMECEHSTPF